MLMLWRRLSPVVLALLCLTLVVPVTAQDGGNLLWNPSFSGTMQYWTRVSGTPQYLGDDPPRPTDPYLMALGDDALEYLQCVNTTGLENVYVGGWLRADDIGYGGYSVAVYENADDCAGDVYGTPFSLGSEEGIWELVYASVPLPPDPDEWGTSVEIRVISEGSLPPSAKPLLDDAFVQENDPTAVVMTDLQALPNFAHIAVIVLLAAAWALLRRRTAT